MAFFRSFLFRSILLPWRCREFFSSLSRWIHEQTFEMEQCKNESGDREWNMIGYEPTEMIPMEMWIYKTQARCTVFPSSSFVISISLSCVFLISLFIGRIMCKCVRSHHTLFVWVGGWGVFFGKIHRDFMEWMQIQCFSWTIIKSERCSARLRDGFFANVLCAFFCSFIHSVHFRLSLWKALCRRMCCCMPIVCWNQPNKFEAACVL